MKKLFTIFSTFFILLLSAEFAFAQCGGTYFNPKYRAVGKIGYQNGGYFLLNDWTGDGRSDFWNYQVNSTTQTNDIIIYPGKPTGYWDWDNPIIYTTPIPTGVSTFSPFVIKDFNTDGKTDILVNSRIYRNNGNGSFTELAQVVHSDAAVSAFMGTLGYVDLNGDGLLDWIYFSSVNPTGQEIRYQLQNPDGSFAYRTIVIAHTTQNNLNNSQKAIGDFNGDGKIDIVYSNPIGGGNKYVMIKGLGNGNFEIGTPVALDVGVGGAVRDFNNDGRADITSGTSSKEIILFGQANGTLSRTEIADVIPGLTSSGPVDVNGDTHLDFLEYGAGVYSVLINNGAGAFTRTTYQRDLGLLNWGIFEDFSGDGKVDVFDGSRTTHNIFGEEIVAVRENVCQPYNDTKSPNFDDNIRTDLVMWNPNTGDWKAKNAIWLLSNPGMVTFNWGAGSFGDVPAPGDFDGDGKTDYSVYRDSTGTWYIRQSSNAAWLVFKFGLSGDIAVPNDYDGGGKTDIAVFRPSDGNWYIWSSEAQTFSALHFGANGDKPVAQDYDGDSKTDVAVYRPSEGNWYYLKSSDGNYAAIHWGISTDKPVPADYDGDGKADLAVYRGGVWYVLRSMNNAYGVFNWGTATDIPVPVYRNGISSDLVIYRPSEMWWYNYVFAAPPSVIGFSANGDVPIYFGLPNN
jgi:FG-GAP-like repeat